MDKYPPISLIELTKIRAILENAQQDPNYLRGDVCPYDEATRNMIKGLIPDPVVLATLGAKPEGRKKAGAPRRTPGIKIEEIEEEFKALRAEINGLVADAKGLEPNERVQIVRVRSALLEKIISMKERIESIKKQEDFIATVIQVMEDELPQELRLVVIEKLEPFAAEEE